MDIKKAAPYGQKPLRLFRIHTLKNRLGTESLAKNAQAFPLGVNPQTPRKVKAERLLDVFSLNSIPKLLTHNFDLTFQSNLSGVGNGLSPKPPFGGTSPA